MVNPTKGEKGSTGCLPWAPSLIPGEVQGPGHSASEAYASGHCLCTSKGDALRTVTLPF